MPKYAHGYIDGLPRLMEKLESGNFIWHPVREAVEKGTERIYDFATSWAPWGTGKTAVSIGKETSRGSRPPWGRVDMRRMPTRKGFRYPGALEGSRKIPYKYRSGPHVGKLTRGWFSRSKGRAGAYIKRVFAQADDKIKQGFDRS